MPPLAGEQRDAAATGVTVTPIFLAGLILLVAGTMLRATSYRQLGHNFTYDLAVRTNHTLVTDGVYAVVRHPSYAALYLIWAGLLLSQLGPGSFYEEVMGNVIGKGAKHVFRLGYAGGIACMCVVFVARTYREDKVLRAEYKGEWETWAAKTPYRLVPYVF